TGDRFAGEWPREQLRAHGIEYVLADKPKSDYYLGLVAHINAGAVELPDDAELLRELRGLERRRGPSGRDRVDHRPNAHDDRANAVAGVAEMLLSKAAAWGFSDIASWYEPPAAEPTEAERQRSAMQRLLDRLTAASTGVFGS